MIDAIRANARLIAIGGFGWIAAAEFGSVPYPWEIEGFSAIVPAALVTLAAGYVAAGKVEGILPDEEGIYLVAFESADETGGKIWELSEDQFDAMEVHAGSLFEWPTSKAVYECKEYRPEENVAVANWRESVAGSQLAGDALLPDALEQIRELRDEFEPEAQKARFLKRRIRSIARRLDRRRLEDQQDLLDPTTNPSFDGDRASVSKVVEEEIPEHLQPESMKNGELENTPGDAGDGDIVGFDLLDDSEPLEREN